MKEIKKLGKVFFVATPIGNLQDISLRAIDTLKSVDEIFCENPRNSEKILKHHKILGKKLQTFFCRSGEKSFQIIRKKIENGQNLAIISDAGTPGISDPGQKLIQFLIEKKINFSIIPGASAFLSALILSGFSTNHFQFWGFIPHKKGREKFLKNLQQTDSTVVFYESSHRIKKCLQQIAKFLPQKKIAVCREITKIFEETLRGEANEILEILNKFPKKFCGEFSVVISEK